MARRIISNAAIMTVYRMVSNTGTRSFPGAHPCVQLTYKTFSQYFQNLFPWMKTGRDLWQSWAFFQLTSRVCAMSSAATWKRWRPLRPLSLLPQRNSVLSQDPSEFPSASPPTTYTHMAGWKWVWCLTYLARVSSGISGDEGKND